MPSPVALPSHAGLRASRYQTSAAPQTNNHPRRAQHCQAIYGKARDGHLDSPTCRTLVHVPTSLMSQVWRPSSPPFLVNLSQQGIRYTATSRNLWRRPSDGDMPILTSVMMVTGAGWDYTHHTTCDNTLEVAKLEDANNVFGWQGEQHTKLGGKIKTEMVRANGEKVLVSPRR